ncbi:MAG: polysaccharide biosynthesis tyrosine autokinase [Chloroflexi bacterium]|nr:polysaccharide biosynthesis tyrosine autokinase [Chloroflexota bacterium]
MTPVYSASVTLLVHQAPTTGTSDYTAIRTSELLARTYSEILSGRPVLEAVIAQLGLGETPDELADKMEVELVRDTQLIRLSVEDTNSVLAKEIVNSTAEVFIAQNQALQEGRYADSLASMQEQMDELLALIEETQAALDDLGAPEDLPSQAESARLETILAGYRNTYATHLRSYEQMRLTAVQSVDNVIIIEEAQAPKIPVRPRTLTNTALAGVVGAMLAVGVGFLVEYLDDTIKTPDDVRRTLGLGTLGAIGQLKKGEDELVLVDQPLSPVSEAFRVLRTNIRFASVDKPLRTILVTSPGPTEGKSTTVANLAVAMAQAGFKVAAVDGDLRRPRLHHIFNIHPREGLTGALLEGSTDGRLQPVQVEGLAVLPAGELPPNPAEMLGSQRMRDLLSELAQHVDVVLIDSPPVLPVTDAAVLAQSVDGVLLVIDVGETRREVARRAAEGLTQVGANLIGVVLNRVPIRRGGYYYYYHDYYGDGARKKRRKRRENSKRQQA